MRNLALVENKETSIWEGSENLQQIRAIFAPNLTEQEFTIFVEMGKSTGLNPFLKEIWAVKYDKSKPAQIFIGRDGYRKSAQRHPLYDYHVADAVYSSDNFEIANGEVLHKYNLSNRGTLIGAYCIAQRKGSSKPVYVYVEIAEYNKKQGVWNDKPATMIKKVAEAQGLKMAFQELFAGTYNEFEDFTNPEVSGTKAAKGVHGLKSKLGIDDADKETGEIIEVEIVKQEPAKFSLDTVKFLMESSSTIEELSDAVEKARLLPEDDRKEIRAIYKAKEKELNESKS